MRYTIGLATIIVLAASTANAAQWVEVKAFFTEAANSPSSKVDAADLNGDGHIDLVFANGHGFDKGGDSSDQKQQAFLNNAGVSMADISVAVFDNKSYNGRAVKLRDIDRDGDIDIVLGTTWGSQTQLFLNDGDGNFSNETKTHLPQILGSVGDLELGDVDGDGDLDLMLTDWGEESPVSQGSGGITKLWLQMGTPQNFGDQSTAMFEDATPAQMPNIGVRWSWDAELVDIDNDYDLDMLVSSYASDAISVHLFTNDGAGTFTDATAGIITQGKYALDVEAMDLNGDSYLDLVTLHDGLNGRNRVLLNNKLGGFADMTDLVWPKLENPTSFDFMGAFYDHDSDAKVDLVLGTLQTAMNPYPDRLMHNQGGKLKQSGAASIPKYQAFQETKPSNGTYAIVLADFNKDRRLDVAMAQNENSFEKKVLLAGGEVAVDTAPPIFVNYEKLGPLQYPGLETLRVRCHDNKSPLMLHDFKQDAGLPYLEHWTAYPAQGPDNTPGTKSEPGQWYGEYLWRIQFAVPDSDNMFYRLCAIDAAGNKSCTEVLATEVTSDTGSSATGDTETTASSSTTDPTQGASESIGSATTASEASSADSTPTDTFVSATEGTVTASETASPDDSLDGIGPLVDPAGCVCNSADDRSTGPTTLAWLLLPLLLRRRNRPARRGGAAGAPPRTP